MSSGGGDHAPTTRVLANTLRRPRWEIKDGWKSDWERLLLRGSAAGLIVLGLRRKAGEKKKSKRII